jgi:transcriptional regulator with XRE-family HTH domain
MSQAEMAERSGVSLGSLKRFESTGKISLESLLKLAHLMNRLSDFDNVFKMEKDLKDIEKLFTTKG